MRRGLLLTSFLLSTPFLVYAAPKTFQELAYYLVDIMNYAIAATITLGLVFFLWGSVQQIMKANKGEGSADKTKFFLTGIIVIFLMVSVWGIVRILHNTVFSGGAYSVGSSVEQEGVPSFE